MAATAPPIGAATAARIIGGAAATANACPQLEQNAALSTIAAPPPAPAVFSCVPLSGGQYAHDSENCPAPDRKRRRGVLAFCRLPGAHGKTPAAQRPLAPR